MIRLGWIQGGFYDHEQARHPGQKRRRLLDPPAELVDRLGCNRITASSGRAAGRIVILHGRAPVRESISISAR